jgi:hypothetical protein
MGPEYVLQLLFCEKLLSETAEAKEKVSTPLESF